MENTYGKWKVPKEEIDALFKEVYGASALDHKPYNDLDAHYRDLISKGEFDKVKELYKQKQELPSKDVLYKAFEKWLEG